jgi:carbon storage regulator CsrA
MLFFCTFLIAITQVHGPFDKVSARKKSRVSAASFQGIRDLRLFAEVYAKSGTCLAIGYREFTEPLTLHGGEGMLVLTRKAGEKIIIGSEITVTVVALDSKRVRIGIEAPDHIRILRSELQDGFKDSPPLPEKPRVKKLGRGRELAGSW